MWYGSRMNKFGKALREARKKKGFTLRAVEEKTDISRQTVLRAEQGHFISLELATKLFDVLTIKGTAAKELLDLYVKELVLKTKKTKKRQRAVARPTA